MLAREAVLLTLPSDGNRPHWSYHHTGTLTRLISFVSRSCENCRVCIQNSHSETPYCAPLNVPSIHLGGGVGRFFRSVHSAFPVISALNSSFPFPFNFPLSPSSFASPKFFICNTYASPASVANKRLTEELNPLDATLTKNIGEGPPTFPQACLSQAAYSVSPFALCPYPLSPFFSYSCALFALTKNSTLFFSIDSALFVQNTRGVGYPCRTSSLRLLCGLSVSALPFF